MAGLVVRGPTVGVGQFSEEPFSTQDLLELETLNQDMVDFLSACVRSKLNILISGGTGSGKTTTLNCLSGYIPYGERIITIEDTIELQLQQPYKLQLESRPPNVEGRGEVTIRDLVRNSLRMRPDRIIVGECRGGEALDMLQAMNTGHEGSMTTIHANGVRDAIKRLETLVMMGEVQLPQKVIRSNISSAIDVIVQQDRMQDGSRKVTAISEVGGIQEDDVELKELFYYQQEEFEDGVLRGEHHSTGHRPDFHDEFDEKGIDLPESIYESD
jgi:pilus assembly protein CpaF